LGIRARIPSAIAAILLCHVPLAAYATDIENRLFLFGGADLARDSASGWAGFVAAPFSKLDEDGMRLKIAGGAGRYRYRTGALASGENEGRYDSAEVMIGRRVLFDPITLTAYAGLHTESHRLREPDPGNPVSGSRIGIKGAIELYARPWEHFVATTFASISSVYTGYQARAALMRELGSWFAFGIEGGMLGNARYSEGRVGLAGTLIWQRSILTLSGGYAANSAKGPGAYTTISLYAPL
jgi:hypothetical protein